MRQDDAGEIVTLPIFAEIDMQLRIGRHIGIDAVDAYQFIGAHFDFLSRFYANYGARLVDAPDHYYYLLADDTRFPKMRLSRAEMLTGMILASILLDPQHLQTNGQVPVQTVIATLEMALGRDKLALMLKDRKRGRNDVLDDKEIRADLLKAIATLARLGFVDYLQDREEVRIRRTIMRFCDPVRGGKGLMETLQELASGNAVSVEDPAESGPP